MSVPNIPGMRRNPQVAKSKSAGGYVPKKNQGSATMGAGSRNLLGGGGGGNMQRNTGPSFAELSAMKDSAFNSLTFTAYWKEQVFESKEKHRCRIVYIKYVVEDGTITVMEKKVPNSGMPQGVFLKKHRVPNPHKKGGFYELEDIKVGGDVIFYGRKFHVCCCDQKTRAYLASKGLDAPPDERVPDDEFEQGRKRNQPMKLQKTAMKEYMEASRGRAVGATKKLGDFLKYDRLVLRFEAYWDDRSRYKGDLNRYTVHFFMADKTMEVLEKRSPNSGKGHFPKLLNRMKLPKDWNKDLYQIDKSKDSERFYTDADLVIGGKLNIYGRELVLTSCDENTQAYFMDVYGLTPADFTPIVLDEDKPQAKREAPPIAPYLGGLASFGDEDDSAASVHSLHPNPNKVKKDTDKQNNVLRFVGRFAEEKPEDRGRRFVITYYMAESMVSVFEMANKNSGIVPGKFLNKMKAKKPDGSRVKAEDFGLGKVVPINGNRFLIDDMDGFTESYTVNVKDVLTRLHRALDPDGQLRKSPDHMKLQVIFHNMDTSSSGFITRDDLKRYIDLRLQQSVSELDMRTIMRFFDTNGDGRISKDELLNFMRSNPDTWPDLQSGDSVAALEQYDAAMSEADEDEKKLRVLKQLLRQLARALQNNTHSFWQVFLKYDTQKNKTVDKKGFYATIQWAYGTSHIKVKKDDLEMLTNFFFPMGCTHIEYAAFIDLLGKQTQPRGV